MSFETVWRSMYSDMSRRTMASSVPKYFCASALVSSVLPTPVGPEKSMVAMGREGFFSPTRARRRARETAATASSWPTTRSCRMASSPCRRVTSSLESCSRGMPVQRDATRSIAATSTVPTYASARLSPPAPPAEETRAHSSCSRSRSRLASSNISPRTAWSFASITWRSSAQVSSISSMAAESSSSAALRFSKAAMRARLPASSIRSMHLSGMNRSATYRLESFTAASTASSVMRHRWKLS
mmetsp:Transcript_180/g.463  ORF Transcript_180/g.463 Transcript_180/m.463 type:complete len:242 (-) Transcript_180:1523-2248(-)